VCAWRDQAHSLCVRGGIRRIPCVCVWGYIRIDAFVLIRLCCFLLCRTRAWHTDHHACAWQTDYHACHLGMPLRSNQEQLGALTINQEQSGAIRSNHDHLEAFLEPIKSNQEQSRSFRSNQEQSGAIRSNQEQSGAITISPPPVPRGGCGFAGEGVA
jgi:hypothetical protein